jgi:methyl-accepting chemotaxis protein
VDACLDAGPKPGRGRLPIGFQVLLGAGGLFSLLVACIVLAVVLVMTVSNNQAELVNHDVPYASSVATAGLAAKAAANDERGFLMSGEPYYLAEANRNIAAARAAFATAAGNTKQAQERQAVVTAHAGFNRWVRAIRQEFALYLAGRPEQAIEAGLGANRELRKQYEASLARAQTLGAINIRASSNSTATSSSRSVTILLTALIVALAAGLAITVWLFRSVARPVYRLVAILSGEG